ncbi:hypothetical protein EJ08DRAFT_617919 [Tothia fuscella]|uniref:MARVEL domain-containing protein n=1 Tax=Tothia fuscella TaxID=1048955 RepID=A0A9P4NJG0_9PEZI|nr:hypothetical protein EJ08DRAFT_617919 [Tothia fuscella]
MAFGGAALKATQTFLYTLCFCCAGIILGIYSYFLSVEADRNVAIPQWQKAVEGISGIGVVYTIFAIILTCFLGGKAFFAFLAIVLDILLCAGFIALAVLTRDGARSCSGNNVRSPFGTGNANTRGNFGQNGFGTGEGENVTYASSIGFACRLNKVCFAVAIIGAFLFLISAAVQLWLGKHHQKEKKYGPSPKNNYKSGSGNRWFKRKSKAPKHTHDSYTKDAELGAVGAGTGGPAAGHQEYDVEHHKVIGHHHNNADFRPSHETGTTVGGPLEIIGNKYETTTPTHPTTGGYHTGPTGTHVNPYGYENNRTTGTNF